MGPLAAMDMGKQKTRIKIIIIRHPPGCFFIAERSGGAGFLLNSRKKKAIEKKVCPVV